MTPTAKFTVVNRSTYSSEGTGSRGRSRKKNYVLEEGRLHPSISETRFNSLKGSVIEDDTSIETGSTGTEIIDNDLMGTVDSDLH